jgi:hypothetical protein
MEARGRARGGFASMLDSHPKRIATFTAESIYRSHSKPTRFTTSFPDGQPVADGKKVPLAARPQKTWTFCHGFFALSQ